MNNSTICTNNLPSPATLSTHNSLSTDILVVVWLVKLAIENKKYSFGNRHTFRLFFNILNLNIRPETRTIVTAVTHSVQC